MFSVLFSFELNVLYIFVNCKCCASFQTAAPLRLKINVGKRAGRDMARGQEQQDGMNNRRNEDER